MRPLRTPSARPEVIVDNHGRTVGDTVDTLGRAAPLGRSRVVFALPLQVVQIAPWHVIVDQRTHLVAAPTYDLLGRPRVTFIHRLLYARWTEDTRRLAG